MYVYIYVMYACMNICVGTHACLYVFIFVLIST